MSLELKETYSLEKIKEALASPALDIHFMFCKC